MSLKLGLRVSLPKGGQEKDRPVVPIQPTLRSRLVFTWASALMAMGIFAFIYFIVGLVLFPIIDLVAASYNFDSTWLATVDLIKNVILYSPIIMFVGVLVWGIRNSSRRSDSMNLEG